ncbi:MAG: hypothetical protein ACLQVY_20460 [Limisphaerales bacterium]
MKRKCFTRFCFNLLEAGATGALAAIAPVSASAQLAPGPGTPTLSYQSSSDVGFHLDADLGPSIMQNFNSPRFGFPGHFSADPGVRFDIAPGYDFVSTRALTLGTDFETGMIYNIVDKVEDAWAPVPGVRVN